MHRRKEDNGIPVYQREQETGLYDLQGLGVRVVRERVEPYGERLQLVQPRDASGMLEEYQGPEKEHFYSCLLDSRNRIQAIDLVSVGTLNKALVHPREVFRLLVILAATAIVVSHNHPSGDPQPSTDDYALTSGWWKREP